MGKPPTSHIMIQVCEAHACPHYSTPASAHVIGAILWNPTVSLVASRAHPSSLVQAQGVTRVCCHNQWRPRAMHIPTRFVPTSGSDLHSSALSGLEANGCLFTVHDWSTLSICFLSTRRALRKKQTKDLHNMGWSG